MTNTQAARAPEVLMAFRMSPQQREELKREAREKGLSLQTLVELRVFGELRPRMRQRYRGPSELQGQLPIAG